MKIKVLNQKGEKVKDLQISEEFSAEVSDRALALYVNYLRGALREPIANSKDRSEVSGGGKKPYKQKGTGRARQGSSRSPLWVGGGVTFGPSNDQNFKLRINKNMKKKVIVGSIGNMLKEDKGIVIDSLKLAEAKTSVAMEILTNVKASGKISLIYSTADENSCKSFRNIAGLNMMTPEKINLITILSSHNLIISEQALKEMEARFLGTAEVEAAPVKVKAATKATL